MYDEYLDENAVPKHRKKRNSSKSKSKDKSDHKHEYCYCIFTFSQFPTMAKVGAYCSKCGKTDWPYTRMEVDESEDGYMRLLTKEEILNKYKDFPVFELSEFGQKYIPVRID